jgi:hypothetical protein
VSFAYADVWAAWSPNRIHLKCCVVCLCGPMGSSVTNMISVHQKRLDKALQIKSLVFLKLWFFL